MKKLIVNVNDSGVKFIEQKLHELHKFARHILLADPTLQFMVAEVEYNFTNTGSAYFAIRAANALDGRDHIIVIPNYCYEVFLRPLSYK